MEEMIMSNEERITKAQALFMGAIYFNNYGNFSREEFIKKMDNDFQILKFKPFNSKILGSASLIDPSISLHEDLGHVLTSADFCANIKYYRPTILHEMIHKFFIKKDKEGNIISSGLHILVDKNVEFRNYIGSSLINDFLETSSVLKSSLFGFVMKVADFGVGANEGYTEWFRANILKNDEFPTYLKLTQVFNYIQKKLESKNLDALEIMKEYGNGNYEYIFKTLNMPKKIGIVFIRVLDYLYVKEYEEEMIKKYLENKKLCRQMKKDINQNKGAIGKAFEDSQRFCFKMETIIKEKLSSKISDLEIHNFLSNYLEYNKTYKLSIFNLITKSIDNHFKNEKNHIDLSSNSSTYLEKGFLRIVKENWIVVNNLKNTFLSKETIKQDNSNKVQPEKEFSLFSNLANDLKCNRPKFINMTKIRKAIKDIKNKSVLDKKDKLKIILYLSLYYVLIIPLLFCLYNSKNKLVISDDHVEKIKDEVILEVNIEENDLADEFKKEEKEDEKDEDISTMKNLFSDGISLSKGDKVYEESTNSISVNMNYDYENLICDSIRVTKGEEQLMEGNLNDIDSLYQNANLIDANVRLRLGVKDDEEKITYIAWLDLQEYIDKTDENSYFLSLSKKD